MEQTRKKRPGWKIALCVPALILAAAAGYVVYAFAVYYRLPDNLELDIVSRGEAAAQAEAGRTYKIATYNIGFGAYTADYSFFMDGGESSWAVSREGLLENLADLSDIITGMDPDFLMLQEVDVDGTRSYHVDELALLEDSLGCPRYVFAQNYDSPFLFYPFTQPHGANRAGILTGSRTQITRALRRSLPISDSLSKFVDLDRCYSVSRVPVANGKELCLYNVHLSAYGMDDAVREGQVGMLSADMRRDFADGNYVVCGGDFNHNLLTTAAEDVPEWAQPFPRDALPEGLSIAFDRLGDRAKLAHNSCRNDDTAYDPETTFTVMADGFLVSDNVEVVSYEALDLGYAYSDHDPVVMEFVLH